MTKETIKPKLTNETTEVATELIQITLYNSQ